MTWHAEPIVLILRRYEPGRSFRRRDRYATTAVAQLIGGGRAYVSGMLNGVAAPIRKRDFLELRAMLRADYGIEHIESERHGGPRVHGAGPASQQGRP